MTRTLGQRAWLSVKRHRVTKRECKPWPTKNVIQIKGTENKWDCRSISKVKRTRKLVPVLHWVQFMRFNEVESWQWFFNKCALIEVHKKKKRKREQFLCAYLREILPQRSSPPGQPVCHFPGHALTMRWRHEPSSETSTFSGNSFRHISLLCFTALVRRQNLVSTGDRFGRQVHGSTPSGL